MLSLGVSCFLQQCRHIGPELPPCLPLKGRQLFERRRITDTGQREVALPVLKRGPHDLAIRWLAGFQSFGPLAQLGPQPGQGLLAQPALFLAVQFFGIRPLTRRSQGGVTGGVITTPGFQVIRQFRVGCESVGVEPGAGDVPARELAHFQNAKAFAVVCRRGFPRESVDQLRLQLDEPFGVGYPLGRRVAPVLALAAQGVPTLHEIERSR